MDYLLNIMDYDKETVGKYRWRGFIDGSVFSLYIPKEQFDFDPPKNIVVNIFSISEFEDKIGNFENKPNTIHSKIEFREVKEHSVRYDGVKYGYIKRVGDPYIPKDLLTKPYLRN